MDPPRTPARSDKKVGSYIQELNLKWHLLLPTGKYSPSPGTGVQPDEEVEAQKCVHYIRLLYFRDRIALDRVIKNFDDVLRDSALSNGWVYKPNQEYNTLPRRSVAPTDSFLGRSDPSWPNRNMLMQRLLNFLQSEAEPLAARIRSAPSISRVSTTATIGTNSPTIDQASPEGPVRSGRGRTPELHHVTAAGKRSKQVEQDHHFGSMPGPSRRRLSGMSVARSNGGSGNPGYSGPPSDVYRNLYPPLEGNIPSTGTGRVVAEVHSKNECTHLGDLWDAPAKSNGKVTTRAPCSEGPGYISTEERQRQIFSTTFRRDLSRNATNIALVGRTGKRKTWLYDEQGKEDASEDEEFFTSRESPPSPSLDYESRRQRKARRRANVEFSSKSEDWVPVYLPSSPSRKASTELVRSRKRSSMDPTMPRHRNSPRARPNEEGSPYLVKVNTYLVQDHRSRPSFQPRNLPAVPPFPRAPSANASFTTNTDTSFTESIFSDAHNEQQSQTTHGGSFSHQRLAADGHSFTRETEVALDDDDVTTDDEDVEMALREWWGEDFEMPLPADRGTQRSPNLSQGLDGMAIQSPEKATLPSFTNEDHPAGSAAIGLASSRVGNTLTVHGLEERLIKHCPFGEYHK
ncbi:MAG: hypothetical protein M1840_007310 [Geoglossum simile]|nr:MAG: hypothetical protein M1840_007310 [Geoglossum simile]